MGALPSPRFAVRSCLVEWGIGFLGPFTLTSYDSCFDNAHRAWPEVVGTSRRTAR